MRRALASLFTALVVLFLYSGDSAAQSGTTVEFKYDNGRLDTGLRNQGPLKDAKPAQLTSDINSPGWLSVPGRQGVFRIYWRGLSTDCLPCRGLVANFNVVMDELLEVRYQRRFAEFAEYIEGEEIKKAVKRTGGATASGQAYRMGSILEMADLFKELKDELRRQEKLLAAQAQKLRQQIAECEKQCQGTVTKTSGIKLGGLPALAGTDPKGLPNLDKSYPLPFPWKGPYPEVCIKCRKLAQRLNELPHWARHLQLAIARDKREVKRAELEWKVGKAMLTNDGSAILGSDADAAKAELKKAEALLAAVKRNFNLTLAAYEKCIKTCPKKTACYQPERSYENISIGPNDTYGSGAEVKETVAGLVGGKPGLGGLGGGGSFGGGLGGKRSGTGSFSESATRGGSGGKEPEMVDDTTTGSFFKASAGEVDMQLRGNFNDDGLLVSTKLDEVPGDGTFHAMWLEDNEGRIIRPTRYLPFSMYRDWQLKVWWTYDRWVDGQHVEHREGGWTETWREERGGLLAFYGGEEGVKNSIWHSLGFDTPVRGIQHLGALFPVTAADLTGPCALRLVTHVALPKEDPVVTQPFVNDLSIAADTASNAPNDDIIVNIGQTFRF